MQTAHELKQSTLNFNLPSFEASFFIQTHQHSNGTLTLLVHAESIVSSNKLGQSTEVYTYKIKYIPMRNASPATTLHQFAVPQLEFIIQKIEL